MAQVNRGIGGIPAGVAAAAAAAAEPAAAAAPAPDAASTSLLSMPLQNINSHGPLPHHSQTRTGVDGAHNEEQAEGEHALNVAQAAGDDAGGLRAGLEEVRT